MKLIDGEQLLRTIKEDCEHENNPNLWFILGFISRYVNDAEEIKTGVNNENH